MTDRRKVVKLVHVNIAGVVRAPARLAGWFRKDYPLHAPGRGHNYLIALCSSDCAAR